MFAKAMFAPSLTWTWLSTKVTDNRWWDYITEHIIVSAMPTAAVLEELRTEGVRAVVTLNEDWELFMMPDPREYGMVQLHLPTQDYFFAPGFNDIDSALYFIEDHVSRGEKVMVHCKAGRGRSVSVVLCYIVWKTGMSVDAAFNAIRQRRRQINLSPKQRESVQTYCNEVFRGSRPGDRRHGHRGDSPTADELLSSALADEDEQ